MEKSYYKVILLGLIVLPLLDNLSGAASLPVSLVFRLVILAMAVIPALSERREKTIALLALMLLLFFPLVYREMTGVGESFLFYDTSITVKILYALFLAEGLIAGLRKKAITREELEKSAFFMVCLYFLPIVLFHLTGTGLSAYAGGGSTAFVRAANDLSLLIGILAPLIYHFCKKIKNRIVGLTLLFLYLFSLLLLTTKSGMIASAMIAFMIFVDLIRSRFRWIAVGFVMAGAVIAVPRFLELSMISRIVESYKDIYREYGIWAVLFRGRDIAFLNIPALISKMSNYELLFGKGLGRFAEDFGELSYYYYKNPWKSAEVDQIDLFFSYGILGSAAIYFYYIKRSVSAFLSKSSVNLKYSLILFWIHSIMAGHGITSPIVGTGISIVFALGACDPEGESL